RDSAVQEGRPRDRPLGRRDRMRGDDSEALRDSPLPTPALGVFPIRYAPVLSVRAFHATITRHAIGCGEIQTMAMAAVPLVLVVDAEADVRTMIAEILEREGYCSRALKSGEAALTPPLNERSTLTLLAYTRAALLPGSGSAAPAEAGLR